MQDRFKFRFYDKDKKIMVKPPDEMSESEWRRCCNIYGCDVWHFSIVLALTKILDYFDNTSFIIMQCTSLKDKNNNLIYEGDIMQVEFENEFKNETHIAVVEYDKKDTGFGCKFNPKSDILYSLSPMESRGLIIGNIYENPELLKKFNNINQEN